MPPSCGRWSRRAHQGGHEVVGEAGNGAEAIERFQELKPEVTTLDITMPEKDGLAALKEIIELDPSARVIMCSALGQESKVLESIKLGAKDFVVKPFQAERVLEAVGKAWPSGGGAQANPGHLDHLAGDPRAVVRDKAAMALPMSSALPPSFSRGNWDSPPGAGLTLTIAPWSLRQRQERLGEEERALEQRAVVALVGLVGGGDERRRPADAGVVDEVVEAVALPVLASAARTLSANAGKVDVSATSSGSETVGGVAVSGDHAEAVVGQQLSGGAADA